MNQKNKIFEYDEETTIDELLLALQPDDFKNLNFKDFKKDVIEKIVFIYKTRALSHDLIIY
jgi:hypothetical protein